MVWQVAVEVTVVDRTGGLTGGAEKWGCSLRRLNRYGLVSGLITTFGKQFRDWSADYPLYAKDRVNEEVIFNQIRKEVEALTPGWRPLCLALDDTLLRKTGRTIPGAAYRKDPLGPPFNLNLVWAQRRIQFSAAVSDAMLHIAALKAYGPEGKPAVNPEAKWRKPGKKHRPSTQDLINELRRESWVKAIRPEISTDFMDRARGYTKPLKFEPNLCSTLFAATA